MPTLRNNLIEFAWRYRVDNFAEHCSRGKWIAYPWLSYVLRVVQAAIIKGNARIIINAPPRHGKSEACAHWLPTWFLDWHPDKRVIMSCYGDKFAEKWGLAVRDEFMLNPETRTRIRKEKQSVGDWMTRHGGGMRSASISGSITGLGAHLLIIDDPHKNWEEAMSPTKRQLVIDQFNSTLYTRLEPGGSIIVIQTRWHERDLSGYLMNEHSENWTHINLPALAEKDDLLNRETDEVLCPERFDSEQLDLIKKAVGSHMFAGLYQQRPSPIEGGMIKRNWFQRWDRLTLPTEFDEWGQFWDLTFGKDTGTSFDVGQVWARKGANFYLLDQKRDRMTFPEQINNIGATSQKWENAKSKYIEDAADAAAIIFTLRERIPGLIAVPARGSKEARLMAVSGFIESGNVFLPPDSEADWVKDFIEEVVTFPNAADDDQVDAMTMALDRLSKSVYNLNFKLPDAGSRAAPWGFANA